MEYFAHITDKRTQTVLEHCKNTAELAEDCLKDIGFGVTARLAGMLHDIGKMQYDFQEYLKRSAAGENTVRGSVIHTFAGVKLVLDRYHHETPDDLNDYAAELIASAIASHHGLFDFVDDRHRSNFYHREFTEDRGTLEAIKNYSELTDFSSLDQEFNQAAAELESFTDRIPEGVSDEECDFYFSFLSRLLSSSVIDADRLDTAAFMNNQPLPVVNARSLKNNHTVQRILESYLAGFPNETKIQKARKKISEICRSSSVEYPGVFTLNAPTGGGKTLSSLRFAVHHAKKWNMDRVIYVAPLLSIIDQTSAETRKALGENIPILEHHSNVVNTEADDTQIAARREQMTENWDAPVIITTLAQFLDTLFSAKIPSVRRFHSLSQSVIILDEVQSIPTNLLSLFNIAVNFLTEFCGTTIVLCSATQPAFDTIKYPLLQPGKDILPYDEELWTIFKRTHIENAGTVKLENVPEYIKEKLKASRSLLVICNKKNESEYIYRMLETFPGRVYHLSAAMCMSHRQETLEEIRKGLLEIEEGKGEPLICVSTQVIEAGIDISFRCVVRLLAGMDSAVQAAGRCNRNGEQTSAPVYLVNCSDEKLANLPDIQRSKNASLALLVSYASHPEMYGNDLSSREAVAFYYKSLYRDLSGNHTEYPISYLKGQTYFELMTDNRQFADTAFSDNFIRYALRQAPKTAGEAFQVYENETIDVLVPYKEGQDCIEALSSARAENDFEFAAEWVRKAKKYTVSIYEYQKEALLKSGGIAAVEFCGGSVIILRPECYDEALGLVINKTNNYLEV